ncbi:MAG: hypothetical protein LQ343_004755 [Gyalolechia ehrenbergii]|nr:MAG: hypothetical protein LQ343_004755 [Gyalolechia ehrenbergii]
MNLRLVVENFMKVGPLHSTILITSSPNCLQYGVLICIRCHDYKRNDILLSSLLYALVPCHLFAAYLIELGAAQHAKGALGRLKRSDSKSNDDPIRPSRSFQATWYTIALAHGINATVCLLVTTYTVYYHIHHPLLGTICQIHAIIVWLKNCSYAFTNRDLRHAYLNPHCPSTLPELYSQCPYPRNVTISNLAYFWWAPTLVYQPIYPRSPSIRTLFIAKRLAETFGLSMFIWLASAQYAAPVLRNSLDKLQTMDLPSIIERLMKLSTISLVIWLAGFFAIFQSALNALAEIMRFGDREFYTDWWNSPSVGNYWRTWNKPVYYFMFRHIYSPLRGRGYSNVFASAMVFVFSGFLHELMVGVPTHNILGVAFLGMVVQLPMIAITAPLERMRGVNGRVVGNCIFWVSFCLVGQPLAALLYFFAWQGKYGSVRLEKG